MAKLITFAAIAAAATLGACSVKQPPQAGGPSQPQPNIVTQVHPYMAGNGVVQSVAPTPMYSAPGAGSTSATSEPTQRLEIKMDNGKVQYVDVPSREFTRGTRVTLTEDRMIRKM
jgi:hypothetical protein